MTLGQGIDLGPMSFTFIRLLIAVGVVRVIVRGERLAGGVNQLDWFMVLWAVWLCVSGEFHGDSGDTAVTRLGLVYDACGFYFLLRIFCSSVDDLVTVCKITSIVLVPVAAEMFYEQLTASNLFSIFGAIPPVQIREGHIRANGPFLHPILAGTVGAVCLPLAIGIWRYHRKTALIGVLACLSIVLASRSSGPLMSTVFATVALVMWSYRHHMRVLRWLAVFAYLALNAVMKAPAYYLLARIDLSGGSTGYHRARLIESTFEHLNEWWLVGTDYTRHWMATGVSWNVNHTDITNHYIQMGVWGGLLLMFLFIMLLVTGFRFVGERMLDESGVPAKERFVVWACGSALFTHTASMISISYFDQSVFFIYFTLAAIASTRSRQLATASVRSTTTGGRYSFGARPLRGDAGFGQAVPAGPRAVSSRPAYQSNARAR